MLRFILSFIFLFSLLVSPALAWNGRVVDVADGDTITVEPVRGGSRVKVRLHGVDCPETRQTYGQAAKHFVVDAALYKVVDIQVTPQKKDRYGRVIAVVVVKGSGVLQERLLDAGLAWVYAKYYKGSDWYEREAWARKMKKGLWRDENPVPPWEWRH